MNNTQCDKYVLPDGRELSIYFFAHASLMFKLGDTYIYVDPLMQYFDRSVTLPKADIILITHSHDDHYDRTAVDMLRKDGTVIISNKQTVQMYGSGEALDNYQTTQHCGVTIKAFAAYNTTQDRDVFHPLGRDNGYLLTADGMRIYISGDTETVDESPEIDGCDILFLAVNQPYTMTIQQAKYFVDRIQPKIFYPYHTTDTDMQLLEKEFANHKSKTIIHSMQ
ncbi:MAG: MBL fold metallo-hydrolase [Bacteroidales bacterium]|nr:MBL fold metallo-hydrolase [Bacteroidales bacterium]